MNEGLEFGYLTDEDLKRLKVSKKYNFDNNATFFAITMRDENAQSVRVTIKSAKMCHIAKKLSRLTKHGIRLFSFGEYAQDFERPENDYIDGIETGKSYHSMCNPSVHIDEKLCGTKKYAVLPTIKWATFIRVKPVEWIIDEEDKMLISRYKLITVPIDLNTTKVINEVFSKDIVPSDLKKIKHRTIEQPSEEKPQEIQL